MSAFVKNVAEEFWNEEVWLPPNTTWADIAPESSDSIQHADYRHLLCPLPLALVMLGMRYLLEKYWFAPVGVSLGIKNSKPKRAPVNAILERAYTTCKKFRHKQVVALAKEVDMTERQVEWWLRLRRCQDKPPTLVKFCENSWRCLYYASIFAYGLIILWDKPWLWNINECWTGFPHQSVTDDIWWYYMISMAFYWSLMVSQFFDVKRKDFWQMFVHHIATIILMALSWIVNVYRVGSLVLVVHDCADILLEVAKMTKYAKFEKLSYGVFGSFTVVWIITRLIIYPFWIIKNTTIDAADFVPMFPAYYIFNSLLILLLALHVFWTYPILKIAYSSLKEGEMIGDVRSSSSNYSEDDRKSH